MDERVNPLKIRDNDNGVTYELDFSRESVYFMDQHGFAVNEKTLDYYGSNIPKIFFYAFRKNHRKMTQSQTDSLLQKMGGLTPKMLERLVLLYNQAAMSNIIQDEEDLEKNSRVTVEL